MYKDLTLAVLVALIALPMMLIPFLPVDQPMPGAAPTVPYTAPEERPLGDRAARRARSLLGAPYRWGGKGFDLAERRFVDPSSITFTGYHRYHRPPGASNGVIVHGPGLDCSGLVFWAFNREEFGSRSLSQRAYASRAVYHEGADGQYRGDAYRISKESLRPGDLLFFDTDGTGKMDHVAMFVGDYRHEGRSYNSVDATFYAGAVVPALYCMASETLTTWRTDGARRSLRVTAYGRIVGARGAGP